MSRLRPLSGTRIVVTRPVGTGAALARRARALGGVPLLLPGASLREPVDIVAARAELQAALACDIVIFTSPAAVRFARRLGQLRGRAESLAPGVGTLRALRRAGGVDAQTPRREDSEGLLELPVLRKVRGKRVGMVGAAGGRGLLQRELAARGANVVHAHVYRRLPARLDARHADALKRNPRTPLYVLISGAEALDNILASLPKLARSTLLTGVAVVSSERLLELVRGAGFVRSLRAASAHAADMLEAVARDRN